VRTSLLLPLGRRPRFAPAFAKARLPGSGLLDSLRTLELNIYITFYDTVLARLLYADLTETVEFDGKPTRTPEVLVFELTSDGRIARVEIFIQTPTG
jgi:hypothetical protein